MFQEAVKEADSDTGNLQKIIEGENEVILLWGNLVKNPRFKSFRFDFEQVFFEIPKPLAMTDFTCKFYQWTKFLAVFSDREKVCFKDWIVGSLFKIILKVTAFVSLSKLKALSFILLIAYLSDFQV